MSESLEIFDDVSNPLDSVEDVLSSNDWTFNRMNEDELTVQVTGKMGTYILFFIWHEEFNAMQFCCQLDLNIKKENLDQASKLLAAINNSLWLGHFDIQENDCTPCFRYTSLFRGLTHSSGTDHIEDLVDIAIIESERYYSVFDLLTKSKAPSKNKLMLAMMETAGES